MAPEQEMSKQQEFVIRTLEERNIRFVRLWFTDVLGFLKSVAIAPAELENAFAEGIGFDGSAIEGFARVTESDMLAKPDPATFSILPWRTEAPGAARMFCDITMPDGSPSPADPRNVLRRTLNKAAQMGYTCYTHPEIEFFLFKARPEKGEQPVPVDQGGYFDHTPAVVGHDFRRQAITLLEAMGISVEFSHHEGGPGQQEIDLRDADALSTADNIMTFRHVIKEVALDQGFYASFMPKPFTDHPGSGMHTHVSLFKGEENAFYDSKAEFNLSKIGRSFIAGILTHAAEITAVTNQWVNSYKRLHGGGEAPALVNWGPSDRGALVRLPMYKPGKENSTRIEFRSPDSACNPYLAYAVMIAAGLKGIEKNYELTASNDLQTLPTNLNEAISEMEKSELVRETLGEHVFEYVLRNKRAEWQDGNYSKIPDEYYIYSDADLELNPDMPYNWQEIMLECINKYQRKASLVLRTDDIPDDYEFKDKILNHQSVCWYESGEPDVYRAITDMTFSMDKKSNGHRYESMRLGGKFACRHIPWYVDLNNINEEEKYYLEHINRGFGEALYSSLHYDKLKNNQ